ncbi:MAG: S26 family signal peptidase [Bdellovibrionia bacterium]
MKSTAGSGSDLSFEELKAKLQREKQLSVRVVTGSMEPVIQIGDELLVEDIQEPLKLFDIIVYWNGSVYICHFVWSLNRHTHNAGERWVVTRSLASSREDFPVLESGILGRVVDREIPFSKKLWIVLKAKFFKFR